MFYTKLINFFCDTNFYNNLDNKNADYKLGLLNLFDHFEYLIVKRINST